MQPGRLTFVCELDRQGLVQLFADPAVIADLQLLTAGICLMCSDFSPERAAVVRKLNEAGVPVVGIPLVPAEEGYYLTPDNAPRATARYEEWKRWTTEHSLSWAGVGLDIEPEARFYEQLMANAWGLVPMLLPRLFDEGRVRRAQEAYTALVARIQADGWVVENYQFPIIADERQVGSTLLQRLLGILDLTTDREVWMQYTSVIPRLGPGLLWSYGPDSPALAVGTTGGGPDVPSRPQIPALGWEEFARDLRLARRWSDDIYIHSLEGCVWQDFLGRLRGFDWMEPPVAPSTVPLADGVRVMLRGILWASVHPRWVLGAGVATTWVAARVLRRGRPG